MRFAEKYKVMGIILVSACHTDLGMDSERQSGYYSRPWDWEAMKKNAEIRIQYGSRDDPFIPWLEMEEVAKCLDPKFIKFDDRGHFMSRTFPEVVKEVRNIQQSRSST